MKCVVQLGNEDIEGGHQFRGMYMAPDGCDVQKLYDEYCLLDLDPEVDFIQWAHDARNVNIEEVDNYEEMFVA